MPTSDPSPEHASDTEQRARDMGDLAPPVDSWTRSWSLVCMGIGFLGSVSLGIWRTLVIGANVNEGSVSATLLLASMAVSPAVALHDFGKYRVALVMGLLSPAPVCVLYAMLFYLW